MAYVPLTLERYGIKLRRMIETDKEIVRLGRNKDFVRNNHVYKEIITPAEQDIWFEKMNAPEHYVLIIEHQDEPCGLITCRDFFNRLTNCVCGAFIWDEHRLSSKVPILAILMALDFFFHDLQLQHMESLVLKTNERACKMNKFFGFTFAEKDADTFSISMPAANYFKRRNTLSDFARRATKNTRLWDLQISGSLSSLNLPEINRLLEQSNHAK